ncbi:hypothetical protein B0J12DRAFT_7601 [Macrophomina phaseolina]|uniref:Uncharacterized protein n=1 Tax=Macrophomina phaseolina TaxID=35725 RepID=A0ABQ8GWH5_9PEZI|nr:hypothetical protein B0J12DRAFT_7601 [Macrophomina phaseolina]
MLLTTTRWRWRGYVFAILPLIQLLRERRTRSSRILPPISTTPARNNGEGCDHLHPSGIRLSDLRICLDPHNSEPQWVADHLAIDAASTINNQSTCRSPRDPAAADRLEGSAVEEDADHEDTAEEWDMAEAWDTGEGPCTAAADLGDGDVSENGDEVKRKHEVTSSIMMIRRLYSEAH